MTIEPGSQPPRGGNVVIVEDEEGFARQFVAPFFDGDFAVHFAFNVHQGVACLDALPQLSLALVDLDIPGGKPFDPARPGGAGFRVVEHAAQRFPISRLVVLTAYLHPALINTAHRLGAEYLAKDDCTDNLRALARATLAGRHYLNDKAATFVERLANAHDLTKRQVEVLAVFLAGRSHVEIAEELAISTNTLKRHVKDILAACGEQSLSAIGRRFWRDASEG